jgi:hypothetical protein
MLEAGGVLRTWALEQLPRDWHLAHARTVELYGDCPAIEGGNNVSALQLGDHRREYLEFEGVLSGDRGKVVRVATGNYTNETESPEKSTVILSGDDVSGRVVLSRSEADGTTWTLAFEKSA